jgi:hypothetical protein
MVKKVILGSLLSMVVVLMMGTAAFAAPPAWPPASCAAHCATYFGGSGEEYSVSAQAKHVGMRGTAQMGYCGDCCDNWYLLHKLGR